MIPSIIYVALMLSPSATPATAGFAQSFGIYDTKTHCEQAVAETSKVVKLIAACVRVDNNSMTTAPAGKGE